MRTPSALLALALLCGASPPSRSSSPVAAPMQTPSAPTTVVESRGLALHMQFDFNASNRVLHVRYTLDNRGSDAIAVFDRGDSVSVAMHKLALGEIPAPLSEQADGALTLTLRALPLPRHTPTVPRIPLAARLDAGHSLDGAFSSGIDATTTRVRACIGIAPFSEELFSDPKDAHGLEIRRASFKAVDQQHLLCTAWFDLATRTFAAR